LSIEEIASASAYSVAPATPAVAPVAVHHFGDICLLDVRGALPTVAGLARDAVLAQWVNSPAAVLCDLTSVRGPVETGAVALLASVGAQVRQWPGIPIGVICSDRGLRDGLTSALDGQYLAVADSRQKIWGDLIAGAVTATVRAVMAPEAQSVRAARELVAAACTDWGHSHQIPTATLVASELVTNAVLHGQAPIELRVRQTRDHVTLDVHDGTAVLPRKLRPTFDDEHGRGLQLVASLAERWGTRPLRHGKSVWCTLALAE